MILLKNALIFKTTAKIGEENKCELEAANGMVSKERKISVSTHEK